jgi:hypothetical protein
VSPKELIKEQDEWKINRMLRREETEEEEEEDNDG